MRPSYPIWATVTVWALIGFGICLSVIGQRQRRRWNHQPYTLRDTLLLLLAGTVVAAVLLYLVFTESVVLNSRVAVMVIVIGGGAALTYLLNRQHTQG